ncbi:MAG: 3-deoxy-7-phosphoheptulonate synthase AroG [Candidatus Velthaea sp.]
MVTRKQTSDVRIREIRELTSPESLIAAFPITDPVADLVTATRTRLHDILHGADDRLIVVIGPCSIHDPIAAHEYASKLAEQRERFADTLEIVMRVYFEKPRTSVGWKGLINDPYMDESFQINDGLRMAREVLLHINELGLPAGSEYLDTITPQYIADLISWGAIGARTTESQIHRELASGLSCPVGFKNGTDGNIKIAIDAIKAASRPHHFPGTTQSGHSAIVSTTGNDDCHLILRGGKRPNYDVQSIDEVCGTMERAGLAPRVMVDVSHGNSEKNYERQVDVGAEIARQVGAGDTRVVGVMIESNLVGGRQDHVAGKALTYGQSVTDPCLDWNRSVEMLAALSAAVVVRRRS